jgi:Cu/Ag efflux protein CusF
MKRAFLAFSFCTMLSATLLLGGCQDTEHSAVGVIKEIQNGGEIVVIDHGAFFDGFMGGMMMPFEAATPDLVKDLKTGDRVRFTITKKGEDYSITTIEKTN